jgi:hypothetical protein
MLAMLPRGLIDIPELPLLKGEFVVMSPETRRPVVRARRNALSPPDEPREDRATRADEPSNTFT